MSDGQGRTEMQGMPGDEDLDALRSPIVAAWDAGRLLNVLAFHMQQDWLLSGRLGQQERVSKAFDDLVLAARELFPTVAAQDDLKTRLCEWHEGWSEYIQSEQHDELLLEANDEIEEEADQEGSDVRGIARRKVEKLVASVRYEVGKARNLIERSLEERPLKAFRLAEAIDQIARPQDAYLDMYLAAEAVADRSICGEKSTVNGRRSKRRRPRRIVMGGRRKNEVPDAWHLPRHAVDQTTRTPAHRQIHEIVQRWRQLDLPVEELKSMDGSGTHASVERLFDAGRKSLIASDLEPEGGQEQCSPRGIVAGSGNQEPPPVDRPPRRSRALKLLLHDDHWQVGREGYEATVQLTTLEWELLAKLIARHDAPTGFAHLRPVWEQFGNAENPSPGTVRGEVSNLSNKLKPLGVAIKNLRNRGWKLFDPREAATTEVANSAAQDA